MHLEQTLILAIFAFITGMACGSFASVAISRIPLGKPIVFGHSNCPKCKNNLKFYDLIPLFSWLVYRGKCRHCQGAIPLFYPLLELICGGMFCLIYLKFGISFATPILMAVALCLLIIINIDLEHKIIPDVIQIALLALGIIYHILVEKKILLGFSGLVCGLALGYILRWVFFVWKKRECLGMGDVKFLAVSGLFLGPYQFISFIFLSGVLGVVSGMGWKLLGKGDEFPFGPALAASLMILLFSPEAGNLFWSLYHYFGV